MMDFAKLYNTVFLSAGGSFKHSNSIEHNTFWQHPQPPNVTSRIIKFLGAYTQLVYCTEAAIAATTVYLSPGSDHCIQLAVYKQP